MQIDRLFEIVYILQDKKRVTARELAEHFEVSQRTIYRNIEALSAAGIPVYMSKGKGGGISLLPDFVLDKAVLTEEEKTDILSSMQAVASVNLNEGGAALKKLSSLLGEGNSDWIEVDFGAWGDRDGERESFNGIRAAILDKKAICFSYSSGKGEDSQRRVYPLKLGFKGQAWYLYGYCNTRNDCRFFKLRRIKGLHTLDETFHMRPPARIFTDKNVFEEEYITLKLKVSPKMAFRVYDEFDTFQVLEDGGFIGEILYPRGGWLFSYIASFGEDCKILEPEDVRLDFKNKIQAIWENYL